MNQVDFDSRKNYLKQLFFGWQTMDKPNLTDSGMSKYYSTYVIEHNLGYLPLVRAWYDPESSGARFPMNGQRAADVSPFYGTSGLPNIAPFQFYVYEVTTTNVTFRADKYQADGVESGTFQFYYKIYADPSQGAF